MVTSFESILPFCPSRAGLTPPTTHPQRGGRHQYAPIISIPPGGDLVNP
jgi:hypothetical protein